MLEKKVFLFDGTSLAYKAFYAIRGLSTSKGFPTNAIYGFIRMFLKLYKDFKPEYLAVAFDVGRKTFRTELLKEYKANRRPTPDNFKVQLPYIKKFLKCFGALVLEKEGYEADDILGTLAKKLSSEGLKVFIVTPDKDMRQLIDENVTVVAISSKTGEKKVYDLETFRKEYGIEPSQIPDLFGLAGDSVDNIPGVPGIGEKGALRLIAEYGNLENLYENLHKLTPKRRETLKKFKEQAFLSRELAKVNTEVPLEISLDELKLKEPSGKCLGELLKELEMKSIFSELQKLFPSLDFGGEELEKSKRIPLEEIEKGVLSLDLFSQPELALIGGETLIVATSKGFSEVSPKELFKILPLKGKIYTFDLKSLYHRLGDGLKKYPLLDLSIGQYLLNPLLKGYSATDVLQERLGVMGIGDVRDYSHYVVKIGREILSEIKREGLEKLYKEVELPLTYVLYRMEKRGVLFDREYLESFGRELDEEAERLKREIFEIAGEVFNVNSPKQLAKVLFEKLGLKPIKKTKSGYSTDVETLTSLAVQGYKIAELLLEYRKLTKLSSTFVKGILKHMDDSGRVHTTFIQTGTATGRLSSAEPNLQNLPVSDEISKKIRHAVTAPDGYTLVWADYSQVELRILAHLSGDEKLIKAYREGKDIHTETAKRLFKVSEVTEELRRVAKTVNFGIIYGMSPHGLSERLRIPVKEAEEYINRYFEEFPGVKEYIERTLKEAYSKGYVRTLFGRKRPLPELSSSNYNVRSFGERAAVNATIQGTAADIMKMAMVKLFGKLEELGAYMILQVHDEIVVEAPNEKLEEVKELLKETMENVVKLSVPLTVEVSSGKHWS
jgi:DNA polymerase-1